MIRTNRSNAYRTNNRNKLTNRSNSYRRPNSYRSNHNNNRNNRNNRSNTQNKNIHPNEILDVVWGIPDHMRANCYVFGLGPSVGRGGYYKNRSQKARPGDRCANGRNDACCFRNKDFDFESAFACEEFVQRITCDNPKSVTKLPEGTSSSQRLERGEHMMAAILSPKNHQDFHFLRRFDIDEIRKVWTRYLKPKYANNQRLIKEVEQLFAQRNRQRNSGNAHPPRIYLWAHQRGWMEGGPVIDDAHGNLIRDVKQATKQGAFNYGGLNYSRFCSYFRVKTRMARVTTQFNS